MEPATLENIPKTMVQTLESKTFNTSEGSKVKMSLVGAMFQDLEPWELMGCSLTQTKSRSILVHRRRQGTFPAGRLLTRSLCLH